MIRDIAIYGAQMVAVSIYYAMKTLYPGCRITSFVVTDPNGNPTVIDGIPVISFQNFDQKDVQVLVAVPENFHAEIVVGLETRGFKDYVCIDSVKEAELMQQYYEKTGLFKALSSYPGGTKRAKAFVGMSKFYRDKQLSRVYEIPDFVYPVQAGAALTDVRVAELRDNTGDNISYKNVNYSELTATYWISKNMSSEYMGLFHYRRMLDIREKDLYRFRENDIDVVLPYPTVHYPNIQEHHRRYLKDRDWEAMRQALEELAPEYAKRLPKVFEGQYFYNYNMLIAKEAVFKAYCDWMFPILQRTEELSEPRGDERADRYIGYLGENLTTLYFLAHANDLKIAHTGRFMLI